jgi:hypothetical protein
MELLVALMAEVAARLSASHCDGSDHGEARMWHSNLTNNTFNP